MLDNLFPIAGNNAIEAAAILVGWPGPRDERLFAPFLKLSTEVLASQGFGAATPVKAFEVEINPNGMTNNRAGVAGYGCEKKSANGATLREVALRDTQFFLSIRDYVRWDDFITWAKPILEAFLQILSEHGKPVSVVTLQYSDKFLWRDRDRPFPTAAALRNTGYLPIDVLAGSPQWHSNQGFFSSQTNHPARLDNINVSLAVENNIPTLGVLIVSQFSGVELPRASYEDISPRLNEAHLANKEYLQKLLAEELCRKISLTGG